MYKCQGLCRQQAGRNKATERPKKIPLEKLIAESKRELNHSVHRA
jgi:hypothetical protein